MPKTYTLTRFYKEAEKLIIKQKRNDPDFVLRVNFELQTSDVSHPVPKLNCGISYYRWKSIENEDYDRSESTYGYGPTPQIALLKFRINLTEANPISPFVGIDQGYEAL
jgi:hypothetical protein